MNTSLSRISYTDALPELVPGGWGRTHPWTHPHLPPTGRPAPAPPSRLQQLLRSLQTVDRYQISSVSSVYIEQLLDTINIAAGRGNCALDTIIPNDPLFKISS